MKTKLIKTTTTNKINKILSRIYFQLNFNLHVFVHSLYGIISIKSSFISFDKWTIQNPINILTFAFKRSIFIVFGGMLNPSELSTLDIITWNYFSKEHLYRLQPLQYNVVAIIIFWFLKRLGQIIIVHGNSIAKLI